MNEWLGTHSSDYQEFLTHIQLQQEASAFLQSRRFEGDLGDWDLLLTSTCKQIEKTNMVFTSKDERPLGKPQVPEEVYGHTSHTSTEEVEKRNNPSRRKDKTMTLNTKVPSASTCTKTDVSVWQMLLLVHVIPKLDCFTPLQ